MIAKGERMKTHFTLETQHTSRATAEQIIGICLRTKS